MVVWNDNVRAALIAFLNAVFPVGQMAGLWTLTGDEVAQIMLMINMGIVFLGLVIKKGQQPGTAIISAKGSETGPTDRSLMPVMIPFILGVVLLAASVNVAPALADWDYGGGGPGGGGDYVDWTPCYYGWC